MMSGLLGAISMQLRMRCRSNGAGRLTAVALSAWVVFLCQAPDVQRPRGEAWPNRAILEHPLLRGLLVSGFEAEAPLFPEDTKIDETFESAELVHVVDADGSQTLAIETVRAGRNLVIQGPPGTGKSQMITNIIASAVHDGKTVLFVAEKMVALEIVHARLKRAGIGAACLELHSRAANKRSVAEELGRTLQSGAAEPNLARDTERLKGVRDRLN